MESFFDKRMSAGWKVSFVVSVLWAIVLFVEGNTGVGIDSGEMFVTILPLSGWCLFRWLKIGKEASDDSSE